MLLLVEDNPADARLVKEALKQCAVRVPVVVLDDGEEALALLHRTGPYAQVPRPRLIVLDLNLPKIDGHHVLAEIRHDPALRDIPVVIFTSSRRPEDIARSAALGATAHVPKPSQLTAFFAQVRQIVARWHRPPGVDRRH